MLIRIILLSLLLISVNACSLPIAVSAVASTGMTSAIIDQELEGKQFTAAYPRNREFAQYNDGSKLVNYDGNGFTIVEYFDKATQNILVKQEPSVADIINSELIIFPDISK